MSDNDDRSVSKNQIKLWVTLAVVFVLGVGGVFIADQLPWQWAQHLLKEIAGSFVAAAVLGFTVDRAAKIELIRDAFHAAFRYVLPPELKEEVARIINYEFLCTDHYMVVTLDPLNGELVRVKIKTERTLKNITRHAELRPNRLAVDEWGHPGHTSEVTTCTIESGGDIHEAKEQKKEGNSVLMETESIEIPSQASVKFVTAGSEVHRKNGEINMYFTAPTVNPKVVVHAPSELAHSCEFGAGGTTQKSRIDDQYILEGTLFPGQRIRVRWWPAS